MFIHVHGTSWIISLDGIPPPRFSALVSLGGIRPQLKLLGYYDHPYLPYLLAWTPMTIFTTFRTTLILGLDLKPNTYLVHELLGPMPLQKVFTFERSEERRVGKECLE